MKMCLLAALLAATGVFAKEKVILDTDIGADLDDQMAVAYLAQEPACELLGVTTVGGGSHIRAAMVSAILQGAGRPDVKVYPGLSTPFPRARVDESGAPKVADTLAKWPHEEYKPGNVAVDFMRKTIHENPGEVTLIAIGHYSNVATLFLLDPEIPRLLKQFVVMGGNFSGGAEWNAVADPMATAVVYESWTGKGRHLSVGNDVTGKTFMDEKTARAFFARFKTLGPAAALAEDWLTHHHTAVLHDPLACMAVFHPEVCKYRTVRVGVSLSPETAGHQYLQGWYTQPKMKPPVHTIAVDADAKRFYEIFSAVVK